MEEKSRVSIVLNQLSGNKILHSYPVNVQSLMVKVSCKPVNFVVTQVYFLTSEYNDEDIAELCDKIEELLALTTQKDNIIMRDFNAEIGELPDQKTVCCNKQYVWKSITNKVSS